ncbi:MAG: hypothetical protein QN155_09270 [Armatimonadota bacterium]|nr:hypothetical protein [Armatimonadota bacterium]
MVRDGAGPLPEHPAEVDIPRRSGEAVCVPPAAQLVALAREVGADLDRADVVLGGLPLRRLRAQAREEILAAAAAYTRGLGLDADIPPGRAPLVVTGHQPFLFHPGVWVKYLLAARLQDRGALALGIPVDSDEAGEVGADAPASGPAGMVLAREVLVAAEPEVPYEALPAPSPDQWAAFLDRLQAHLEAVPLERAQAALRRFRELTVDLRAGDLGAFFTAARHRYEGLRYLEVPVSILSRTDAFRRYALHLLGDADRFAAVYNRQLQAYRERHGVRTRAQPFPDLERDDRGVEAPFWLLRAGRRLRVFVRRRRDRLVLAADADVAELSPGAGPQALEGLELRPRALTLTLFTRLVVADLFLHGVGGGRYDRVTDAVIADYLGLAPPAYAVATATLHLPLAADDLRARRRELRQRLMRLQHNPDRVLDDPTPEQRALIEEKWSLVASLSSAALTRRQRRQITHRIREINAELSRALGEQVERLSRQLRDLDRPATEAALAAATHRGYPYCYFPVDDVAALVDGLLSRP